MDISEALMSAQIPRIDAEVLLAFMLQCDRTRILAHPKQHLSKEQQDQWKEFAKRRREGEPVAYITGEREFYGRIFHIDRRVHIPRPSTENLVTMALDFLKNPKDEVRELEMGIVGVARALRPSLNIRTIVDVCTGSGCIGVTLALERPDVHVIATDISVDALDVARMNTRQYGLSDRITLLQGDMWHPLEAVQDAFLVVTNPPYLSVAAIDARPDIHYEPRMSLYGGSRGCEIVDSIIAWAEHDPRCAGIVCEREQTYAIAQSAPA